jgi:hypothetical protein
MTAGLGSRRPPRGALLTVSLARSESDEWAADAEFRAAVVADVQRRARERGRRFFEVYDVAGRRVSTGEVAA